MLDRDQGLFANPDKFHYINHKGKWFDIKGPLNVPRPPQGQPVLIQAGVSGKFQDISSQHAEVVFVVHAELDRARDFYNSFKQKVTENGRPADAVKVLPGIVPIVGRTRKEALEKEEQLKSLILPEAGLSFMSASMNFDLSQFPQDALLPDITEQITGSRGRFEYVIRRAIEKGMTVGEVGKWYADVLLCAGRYRRRGRRPAGALVHVKGLRRLRDPAALYRPRSGPVPRRRRPGSAEARPVPHGISRNDVARHAWPVAAGQPVHIPSTDTPCCAARVAFIPGAFDDEFSDHSEIRSFRNPGPGGNVGARPGGYPARR
ncbi:LLM class flavin-dependent oxidoreductase [Agrobacterium tumefaciens]|uniref:LLM class flavin-dependent oxidoreductase n=1 Tax=Agrobacterium tumefaciens TaxID=358 RepID=UPI002FDA978F